MAHEDENPNEEDVTENGIYDTINGIGTKFRTGTREMGKFGFFMKINHYEKIKNKRKIPASYRGGCDVCECMHECSARTNSFQP